MQSSLVKLLSPVLSTLKHQCSFSSAIFKNELCTKIPSGFSSILGGSRFEDRNKRHASSTSLSRAIVSSNDAIKGRQLLQVPLLIKSIDIIKRSSSETSGSTSRQLPAYPPVRKPEYKPKAHLRFSMKIKPKMIKASRQNGKMVNMDAITDRFFRLDWGAWIHTIPKRRTRLWKRSPLARKESPMHVFAPEHMHLILDNMTSAYYKKKKYFVDDPYESYQSRTNFEPTKYKHLEGNVAKYYRYYAYDKKWHDTPFKHKSPEFDLMIMQKPRKRP